jgi:GT2 family glycosyltransferase
MPRKLYLVQNPSNMGFAGGNNVGVRLALNDVSCSYVWLLNNDTTVNAETLPAAVARMQADPTLGICGATLVYAQDRRTVQALGGAAYSPITGRSRHIGAFSTLDSQLMSDDQVEAGMSYVVGASMLVRREFLENVGLMREDYFLYCEELDWALRARGRYRLGYASESIVFHKEGASIGTAATGGSPLSCYYLFRNRLRVSARFFPLYLPLVLVFAVIDATKLAARGQWKNVRAALRGLLQLPPEKPIARSAE